MVFKKINRTVAISLSLVLLGCQSVEKAKGSKQMIYHESSIDAFQIIGIKTRTSNSDEMKGAGRIPSLWNTFYSMQILNRIPGKLDQDVVAVYYNYESDANAPYSLLIGAKVKPGTQVPEGMEILNIPTQNYSQFKTKVGEMPGIIFEMWKEIWDLTERSELKRKYSYDLEVYGKNAANPKSAQVDLFISVK